jgi:hypothetical protein
MTGYIQSLWSRFQDWKEEAFSEDSSEGFGHYWNYYYNERAVLHGLPIAMISTMATAYLFDCAKTSTGATFGLVNYITLTCSLEAIRHHQEIDTITGYVITGINGAVSLAFIRTVCNTEINYQTAIVLGIAAFAGQFFRQYFIPWMHENQVL